MKVNRFRPMTPTDTRLMKPPKMPSSCERLNVYRTDSSRSLRYVALSTHSLLIALMFAAARLVPVLALASVDYRGSELIQAIRLRVQLHGDAVLRARLEQHDGAEREARQQTANRA